MKPTPFYQSKTLGIASLNLAILHFYPGAKDWVGQNPEAYAEILTFAILALRTLTTKAIKWENLAKAFLILCFLLSLTSCSQNNYQTVSAEVFINVT